MGQNCAQSSTRTASTWPVCASHMSAVALRGNTWGRPLSSICCHRRSLGVAQAVDGAVLAQSREETQVGDRAWHVHGAGESERRLDYIFFGAKQTSLDAADTNDAHRVLISVRGQQLVLYNLGKC